MSKKLFSFSTFIHPLKAYSDAADNKSSVSEYLLEVSFAFQISQHKTRR